MARLAAYLIILAFLLGNLLRIPIFSPNIIVTPLDLAVMFIYFVYLVSSRAKRGDLFWQKSPSLIRNKRLLHYVRNDTVMFLTWLLISLIAQSLNHSITKLMSGYAYFLRYLLYFFSFYPISKIFTRNQLQNLITALAMMFPIIGIIQYFWYPDLRPFTIYGWDEHYLRVFGTTLDPNFFGLILIWCLLNIRNIYYWTLGFLVFCFTYSRSSFLSFLTGFGFMYLSFEKLFRYLGFSVLVILSVILLPRPEGEGVRLERTVSITARTANLQYAWEIIRDHPVFGVGFNLLKGQYANIDNSFLFITATSGFIGLALYLNFLFYLYSKIKTDPKLTAFFIAILVHSLFNNSQFFPPVILLFTLSFSLNNKVL